MWNNAMSLKLMPGDVMVLDNLLAQHSRMSYKGGVRKILVNLSWWSYGNLSVMFSQVIMFYRYKIVIREGIESLRKSIYNLIQTEWNIKISPKFSGGKPLKFHPHREKWSITYSLRKVLIWIFCTHWISWIENNGNNK